MTCYFWMPTVYPFKMVTVTTPVPTCILVDWPSQTPSVACAYELSHPSHSDWHVTQWAGPMRFSHRTSAEILGKLCPAGLLGNWKLGTAGDHLCNHKRKAWLRRKQWERTVEPRDGEREKESLMTALELPDPAMPEVLPTVITIM